MLSGGSILARASNSVNKNFSLTKTGNCFDFPQIRAVCTLTIPTPSHACRGALHSRKRPSLGRRLGAAPRFGEDVSTSISVPYGGDRPRNQVFPPPAGLLIVHAPMLDRTGRHTVLPGGKRVRREGNPALPQPADGWSCILGCLPSAQQHLFTLPPAHPHP
jgi:hypothetical protein